MHRRPPFPNPHRLPFNPKRRVFAERIRQAFMLFEDGDYAQSAALFEELAHQAEARNGPRYPHFYIQAGRGYLYAKQPKKGLNLIENGRQALIESGRDQLANHLYRRVTGEAAAAGLLPPGVTAPLQISTPPGEGETNHPPLPLQCPACGASVHPDEVTWLDASTAECDYCGSALRGLKG